jgi:hypothetical protein
MPLSKQPTRDGGQRQLRHDLFDHDEGRPCQRHSWMGAVLAHGSQLAIFGRAEWARAGACGGSVVVGFGGRGGDQVYARVLW